MSSIKHKYYMLKYYSSLVNPFIKKKSRICRKYGSRVEEYYDFLDKSQWWTNEELKSYQTEKLKKLISYVYCNVPYYHELMKENKLTPIDIQETKDINKIPILNKEIIKGNKKKILSNDFSEENATLARTGASTGEPLVFYRDKKTDDVAWAAFLRFLGWVGYEWGDKMAYFWRTPDSLKKTGNWYQNFIDWYIFNYVSKTRHFDAFKMNENYFDGYARIMQKCQPELIKAYPSALIFFTNYCINNNIQDIRPKAIITTAEPTSKRERKLIKGFYKCDVFDQYGFGEIFSVSFECEKHEGLHINTEHCIVEIVDDNGNEVEVGKEGRIVVTDLDNYMMPFIRYECGDIGSLKEGSCSCGRNLPMMNHVNGRIFGLIRGINGNVVHGEFFADLLQDLGWYEAFDLMHFEIIQKTIESFDCNFVCEVRPGKDAIKLFIESCQRFFGEMKINMNFIDSIPLTPAGKRRNTRSEIDPIRNVSFK